MPTQLTGAPVIRWRNRNIPGVLDISGTNIYRSTSPMDINAMPAPYDTVDGDAEYYADITAEYGATYYYRIGVFDSKEEKISDSELMFVFGDDSLREPFKLEGEYYETDSGDLLEPTDLTGSINRYIKV